MKEGVFVRYLLYAVFGKPKYSIEAVYSILTFFRVHPDSGNYTIVVVCDNGDIFKRYLAGKSNVIIEQIPQPLLDEWQGGDSYMPKLKIRSIQYFFDQYQSSCIFFDSDTFFLKKIDDLYEQIEAKQTLFYSQCTDISDVLRTYQSCKIPLPKLLAAEYRFYSDLAAQKPFVGSESTYLFPGSVRLYNSGVIGLSLSLRPFLDDVVKLCDLIYKRYQYWSAEEAAFSLILQKKSEIRTCDDHLYHYANAKFCRLLVAHYLNTYVEDDRLKYSRLAAESRLSYEIPSLSIIPYLSHFMTFYLPPLLQKSGQTGSLIDNSPGSCGVDRILAISRIRPYYHRDSNHFKIKNNYAVYKKLSRLWLEQNPTGTKFNEKAGEQP